MKHKYKIIDVTKIEGQRELITIFDNFEVISVGYTTTIHKDHYAHVIYK